MSNERKSNRCFINHEQLYEEVKEQYKWEFMDKLYKYNVAARNDLISNNLLLKQKNLMKVKLFVLYEKMIIEIILNMKFHWFF